MNAAAGIPILVPSFRGALRVQRLLESVEAFDESAFSLCRFVVVEDPSDDESTRQFERVLRKFPQVVFRKLDTWSNMHGAADKAFRMLASDEFEWAVYLGDDVLVTPGALTNLLLFLMWNPLRTVGLVQIPYWNAHDLTVDGYQNTGTSDWHPHGPGVNVEKGRPYLLQSKDDMYCKDPEWLRGVPENPHWNGGGFARPYINVNGAGFACRVDHYKKIGGFAEGTWCLDESISYRTWTRSNLGIVTLPGPTFVHYFGGATNCDPPQHDLYTEEAWVKAIGHSKRESGEISRAIMGRRAAPILDEMMESMYWSANAVSGK